MPKIFAVSALFVVLAGGLTAWYLNAPDKNIGLAPLDEVVEQTQPEVTLAKVGDSVEPKQAETRNTMSPAKRIRHGTAIDQKAENAQIETPALGNEKTDKLSRRVDAAIDGQVDELIQITRLINDCRRGFNSEEQLQQRLDFMAQRGARSGDMPSRGGRGGGGGSVEFQSFEELEASLWNQYDRCQVSKEVLDETLHEQIERLAESGLASARYLYAVWPPGEDMLEVVDTLEMLEYQSLALEYTWMNMNEREPLGLLAMAQSYGSMRTPMFTPPNRIQSQVFLLASMKCGIDNKWLEERSLNFGQGFSRFQGQNTEMPSLDEDAAALAEMFCPRQAEE